MSRAFVKEQDGDQPEYLPDLPASPHPNFITPRGLAWLKNRFREARIKADATVLESYESALAEREYRWLQQRISSALVVDPRLHTDRVAFGAIVTLKTDDGQTKTFQIVGEDEANPAEGRVSWISPLAKTLKDARVGDVVTWYRPAGDKEVEVLAIRYDEAKD